MGDRGGQYKAGADDFDSSRGRRKDQAISLRKQKREEKLLEKRGAGTDILAQMDKNIKKKLPLPVLEDLPQLVQDVFRNDDIEVVRTAATQIRRLLSSSKQSPPLSHVIQTGVVPRLVQLMAYDDDQMRIETAWTLTNLASGTAEQTQVVVNADSVPVFIHLLRDKNPSVAEQCMWALGNIAGDRPQLRNLTMQHKILPPLLHLLEESYNAYTECFNHTDENDEVHIPKQTVNMMRTCTWTFSNLCRGKNPTAELDTLRPALPLLSKLVRVNDRATIADACWACSFISDLPNGVQTILDYFFAPRLVELLRCDSADIVSPTLRAIGNIVAGNEGQTQSIINLGGLSSLLSLLGHEKAHIRKESCWALSNVTAGTADQVAYVIEAGLVPPLLRCMEDPEERVCKEASWAVANAAHSGQDTTIHYLVEQGAIEKLCGVLRLKTDPKTLCVILLGLKKILMAGRRLPSLDGQNPFAIKVQECGGVETITGLKDHDNQKVYEGCVKVLDYILVDESAIQDTQITATDQNNGYVFQTQQNNNFQF